MCPLQEFFRRQICARHRRLEGDMVGRKEGEYCVVCDGNPQIVDDGSGLLIDRNRIDFRGHDTNDGTDAVEQWTSTIAPSHRAVKIVARSTSLQIVLKDC